MQFLHNMLLPPLCIDLQHITGRQNQRRPKKQQRPWDAVQKIKTGSYLSLTKYYFFLFKDAFTTPFGSLINNITSQIIRPSATTARPRKKSLSISCGAGAKTSAPASR